jgi:hypothetical protein
MLQKGRVIILKSMEDSYIREIDDIKKNQMEKLELNSIISKIKYIGYSQ